MPKCSRGPRESAVTLFSEWAQNGFCLPVPAVGRAGVHDRDSGGAWDNAKKYIEKGAVWLPVYYPDSPVCMPCCDGCNHA